MFQNPSEKLRMVIDVISQMKNTIEQWVANQLLRLKYKVFHAIWICVNDNNFEKNKIFAMGMQRYVACFVWNVLYHHEKFWKNSGVKIFDDTVRSDHRSSKCGSLSVYFCSVQFKVLNFFFKYYHIFSKNMNVC